MIPGLHLGPALRWSLLTGLVATNHAVDSSILRESEQRAYDVDAQLAHRHAAILVVVAGAAGT